jgi:DNA-binding MarR family transcriptional regulator
MQLLDKESDRSATEGECAALIMEVVPLVMHSIRAEMRSHRGADLSVPHFRALAFLQRQPKASLSDIAEHIGVTLPSMSKMIDVLVERRLVTREISSADRRCVTLALTAGGKSTLESARRGTRARLAHRLKMLSATDRETVVRALQALRPLFTSS